MEWKLMYFRNLKRYNSRVFTFLEHVRPFAAVYIDRQICHMAVLVIGSTQNM